MAIAQKIQLGRKHLVTIEVSKFGTAKRKISI